MTDFETVPVGTMQRLKAVEEERDDLAAHVEEAAFIIAMGDTDAERRRAWINSKPDTTSLARRYAEELMNGATPCPDGGKCHKSGLTCGDPICEEWGADLKAEWQAEALESLWPRLVTKADQQITRHHARGLRRQSQEGGDGHH